MLKQYSRLSQSIHEREKENGTGKIKKGMETYCTEEKIFSLNYFY